MTVDDEDIILSVAFLCFHLHLLIITLHEDLEFSFIDSCKISIFGIREVIKEESKLGCYEAVDLELADSLVLGSQIIGEVVNKKWFEEDWIPHGDS